MLYTLTDDTRGHFFDRARFDTDGGSFALANGQCVMFDAIEHQDDGHGRYRFVVQVFALPDGASISTPEELNMGGAIFVEGLWSDSIEEALRVYAERITAGTRARTLSAIG